MNKQAYKLFHQGTLALADIEQNGIRIDIDYCKEQQQQINTKIKELENSLAETEEVKVWKKLYKENFKINSNDQLKKVLFDHFNLEPPKKTAKGNASVDKESLHLIKSPIVKPLIKLRQLQKLNNTYLKNIIEETVDGFLHPFFNLNTVTTFRSSSSSPNFQNMPIRDPYMGKIIRQAFISRFEGGYIGGLDYSGIELSMAGCNSKDPLLIKNFGSIHKTEAANCYALSEDQVTKDTRYCAKNKFVFPQLYGSWYEACAPSLFNAIKEMDLKSVSGMSLKEHLKIKRISGNGYKNTRHLAISFDKFTEHIKKVEYKFWKTYHVHKKWQDSWIKDYEKKGYIKMLTGFVCSGNLTKNQILNYANQGPAFHCLLWSLIKTNKWLKKYKMKSKIIGQIHDDMMMDIHPKEFQDVLQKVKEIMCIDIKKEWEWIITPLMVEAEFSNQNWYEKKEITI